VPPFRHALDLAVDRLSAAIVADREAPTIETRLAVYAAHDALVIAKSACDAELPPGREAYDEETGRVEPALPVGFLHDSPDGALGRRIRGRHREIAHPEELDRVAHNRERIAELKAAKLPLPGQSPEQARAIRAMQRR
jgi:hypothetical protein